MANKRLKGSITKRGAGRYRLRYPRGKGRDGKRLPDHSKDFQGTEKDALDALEAWGRELEEKKAQASNATLASFLEDRFLHYIRTGLAPRTRKPYALTTQERYRDALHNHVIPRLGNRRLADITLEDLEWLTEDLRAGHLAENTVGDVLAVVKAAFRYAYRHKLIPANPCEHLVIPSRKPSREVPQVSVDLAMQVIDLAAATRFHLAAILAFAHALRREEILALRWRDVDLDLRLLHVRRALVAFRRPSANAAPEPVWKEPKTVSSARSLPIVTAFLEDFRSERRAQLRMRMRLGSSWRGPGDPEDDLIVAMEDGRPWRPDSFSTAWRRFLAKEAPSLPRLTAKDGRSAWVSITYAAGADPAVLAEWAGHSEAVARSRYQRTLEESKANARAAIEQQFVRPRNGGKGPGK